MNIKQTYKIIDKTCEIITKNNNMNHEMAIKAIDQAIYNCVRSCIDLQLAANRGATDNIKNAAKDNIQFFENNMEQLKASKEFLQNNSK